MIPILAFLGSIAGFIAFVWGIGFAWNRYWWVRDGRPELSADEQLLADHLRANGFSTTLARRTVLRKREGRYSAEIRSILDIDDLMTNPDRDQELRSIVKDISSE